MKTVTLTTQPSTAEGTFGELVARGSNGAVDLVMRTVELPWHDNKTGISCIPAGEYSCVWHESPSKGWCYKLENTAPRQHILIHSANFAGDESKGWQSQLEGCIALGTSVGKLTNRYGRLQLAVKESKVACNKFFTWGREEKLKLVIARAGGK